jgi:hypothetical protein
MKRRQKRKHLENEESQTADEKGGGMCWAACQGEGMLASLSLPEERGLRTTSICDLKREGSAIS